MLFAIGRGKPRLGQDTVYDENVFKNGQRLSIKLSNAFRFMMIQMKDKKIVDDKPVKSPKHSQPRFFKQSMKALTTPVDQAWIQSLWEQHQLVTQHLEQFQYARALDLIEKSFWLFCDNYLELIKTRAYQLKDQEEGQSAIHALDISLYVFIKMLAPYIPYTTENLWIQKYSEECSSVHISAWDWEETSVHDFHEVVKTSSSLGTEPFPFLKDLLSFVFPIIEQVRAGKSSQKKSLSIALKELSIQGNAYQKRLFDMCKSDIGATCKVSREDMVFTLHSLKDEDLKINFLLDS